MVREAVPTVDFQEVYKAEFGYVWHSLRRLGVQERDIEDLCHDVFVVVFRNLTVYDTARPIRPWLFGIAFRVASDYRRSARVRRELPVSGPEPVADAPRAEETLIQAEARQLVARGLHALEIGRRAVFVMHDIDGHRMPEIARVLGIPLNTAYSRLRLARVAFHNEIKKLRGIQHE